MDPSIEDLCQKIIRAVKLEGVTPADIDPDAPLFNTGLGLDSIDALELVVMVEKEYKIVIENAAIAETAFRSVNALAKFIRDNQASCKHEKPS